MRRMTKCMLGAFALTVVFSCKTTSNTSQSKEADQPEVSEAQKEEVVKLISRAADAASNLVSVCAVPQANTDAVFNGTASQIGRSMDAIGKNYALVADAIDALQALRANPASRQFLGESFVLLADMLDHGIMQRLDSALSMNDNLYRQLNEMQNTHRQLTRENNTILERSLRAQLADFRDVASHLSDKMSEIRTISEGWRSQKRYPKYFVGYYVTPKDCIKTVEFKRRDPFLFNAGSPDEYGMYDIDYSYQNAEGIRRSSLDQPIFRTMKISFPTANTFQAEWQSFFGQCVTSNPQLTSRSYNGETFQAYWGRFSCQNRLLNQQLQGKILNLRWDDSVWSPDRVNQWFPHNGRNVNNRSQMCHENH